MNTRQYLMPVCLLRCLFAIPCCASQNIQRSTDLFGVNKYSKRSEVFWRKWDIRKCNVIGD